MKVCDVWLWLHTLSAPVLPRIRSENSLHQNLLRHATTHRTTTNVDLDTHSAATSGALRGTAYNLPARPDQAPQGSTTQHDQYEHRTHQEARV